VIDYGNPSVRRPGISVIFCGICARANKVVGVLEAPSSSVYKARTKEQEMNILPVFNGYTVDERLREFRKMRYGDDGDRVFVPFDSPIGARLYEAYYAGEERDTEAE